MLRYIFALWNSDYVYYTIGSLFLIIVVRQFCNGFWKTGDESCCQRQRKVRRSFKGTEQRVWRSSQEDTKTPLELLSILKSQTSVPKESSVRKLLCKDPACSVCNSVALETKFLLSGEKDLHSPPLLNTSPGSSCLEAMSMSTFSLDQSLDLSSSMESLLSPLPVQTPLFQRGSLSPPGIPDYWTEQLGKKNYVTKMSRTPSEAFSSSPEKPKDRATKQDASDEGVQSVTWSNKNEAFKSKDILLNTEFLQLTRHPSTIQSLTIFPNSLSFLSPEVQKLLEMHIKKRVHFQRWGLPKRVEESLKQLMPDICRYYYPGNQTVPFIPEEVSNVSTAEMKTAAVHPLAPSGKDQPGQPFLGSEMIPPDLGKADPKRTSEESPNPVSTDLPPPSISVLNNNCPLNEGTTSFIQAKKNCLQQKYSQLFWGLPSLHSESLVATFLRHDSLSPPKSISPLDSTFLFNELSFLPLLPHSPPPSPPALIRNSIKVPDKTQIDVPFFMVDECETLEWHLQRQLQMLWGLPPLIQMHQQSQSPLDHELCEADKALMLPWPTMNVSVLTRELFFFPDHARRLLELHFQRRLLQHQLKPPQSIQKSMPLLLSPTNQLQEPENTSAEEHMRLHQNENPPLKMAQAPTLGMTPVRFVEPKTYDKTRLIVQMHIKKKCLQIKQGIFPDIICGSWNTENQLSAGDPPTQRTLEAANSNMESEGSAFQDPNAMAWMELSTEQQTLTPLGKAIMQADQTATLPQSMIEKLEIILRHKYLAFLSGLPALYYVALYRAMSPSAISQSDVPGIGQGVIKEQIDPKSYRIWAEEQSILPKAEINDSTMNSRDTGNELLILQQIKVSETLPKSGGDWERPEGIDKQRRFGYPQCPYSPSKSAILTKMDSHLRKKVLEVNMGIPQKATDSRELSKALESPLPEPALEHVPTVKSPESPKELHRTLNSPGSQEFPDMCSSPAAPDAGVPSWTFFKEQLSNKLELSLMSTSENQTQSCLTAIPLTSPQIPGLQASKVTQPHSQKKPIGDMADAQVLCVHVETEQSSPGQGECWNIEPQSPWDGQAKAISSTPNKIEDSKGEYQGGGDAGWGTSPLKRRNHALKTRRPTKSPMSRTQRSPHPGDRDPYQTTPLQKLPQSFSKAKNSGAPSGVPGRKETERHDYGSSQRKMKDSSPPSRDLEHSQPSGPKNPIKVAQRTKSVQAPEGTVYTPQGQTSSENSFMEKIKHFLHWLSLRKKLRTQSSTHTFPWAEETPSKKGITKQVPISAKGSTSKGQKSIKKVEFKECSCPFTSKNVLDSTEGPPTSQVHHPNCHKGHPHFWNPELCQRFSGYSDTSIQQENNPSSFLPSGENFCSLRKKAQSQQRERVHSHECIPSDEDSILFHE